MMPATQLMKEAEALGAKFRLEQGKVKITAPAPLPETLMSELREHKAELVAHLSGADRCLGCICDNPIPGLTLRCPVCQSMTCGSCRQCTAYRRGWDPGWIEPDMLDNPLPGLLGRLRSGQRWLTEKDEEEYIGDLFGKMLAVWDEIEIAVRHVHEYRDCIHVDGSKCPVDAPVRCFACVPIPGTDVHD